jgi:hypothetical protein
MQHIGVWALDQGIPATLISERLEAAITTNAAFLHRALLEVINTGTLPRLASGGIVGDDGAPLASSIGGTAIEIGDSRTHAAGFRL